MKYRNKNSFMSSNLTSLNIVDSNFNMAVIKDNRSINISAIILMMAALLLTILTTARTTASQLCLYR